MTGSQRAICVHPAHQRPKAPAFDNFSWKFPNPPSLLQRNLRLAPQAHVTAACDGSTPSHTHPQQVDTVYVNRHGSLVSAAAARVSHTCALVRPSSTPHVLPPHQLVNMRAENDARCREPDSALKLQGTRGRCMRRCVGYLQVSAFELHVSQLLHGGVVTVQARGRGHELHQRAAHVVRHFRAAAHVSAAAT